MQDLSSEEKGKEHDDRRIEYKLERILRCILDSEELVCNICSLDQSAKLSSVGEVVEEKSIARSVEDEQISCDSVNTLDDLCVASQRLERRGIRYKDFKPFEDTSMRESERRLQLSKRTSVCYYAADRKWGVRGPRLSAPTTGLSTTVKGSDLGARIGLLQ